MWKLTIKQKRKSEYTDNMITEYVEFTSNNVNELTVLVARLTALKTAVETEYKLEMIEKEGVANE
jgi:hypothetical protein